MSGSSRYTQHRETVHPLMSIGFATLATWSIGLIIGDLLPFLRQSIIVYLIIAAVCIEESVVGNMLDEEHAGLLARFREFLIIVIGSHILFGAVRSGSIIARYYPTIPAVYPVALIAIGWMVSAGAHKRLRSREQFLKATGETKQEDLHHAIRELTAVSVNTLHDLRRLRGFCAGILVAVTFLLILAWAGGATIRFVTAMAYVLACIDLLVILALASIFADEFIYLGDGLRLRRVDVRRKLVFGGLIAAVAAVFAFVAASNRSLLSLELFSRFFEWFASLFPETEPAEGFPLSLSPQQIQNIEALRQLEELMQDQEPSRFWIALVRTIRTLIIAGALVGLAILVVGPFLSEEFSDRVRSARPLDAIMRRVRGFMRFFRRMFRLTRRWWRRLDLTVLRIPRPPKTRSEPDPPRQGLRKRRQVSRVSAKFLALIAWSTERGYTYRKSHVPTEYGRRLQAGFPALTQPIDTAIEVFEEAMYSDHVIAGSRMRAYDRAIDSIVKSGIPPANANSARSG